MNKIEKEKCLEIIALHNRGDGVIGASDDMEDIINLLNGRKEFEVEVQTLTKELKEFLRDEAEAFLPGPSLSEAI